MVRVPDADVLLAGDLVEESAPPSFNDDSWPMEWPLSLDIVLGLTDARHRGRARARAPGRPGLRRGAAQQLGVVAETIRDLASRGVPLDQALAAGEWPWPAPSGWRAAVRRGYEQLPRSQKRLPLV